MRPAIATCALLPLLCGCATKQRVLYPNPRLEEVGREAAQHEVAECQTAARDFQPDDAGRDAAAGATGSGRSAASDAASAATFSLVRAMFRRREPDPVCKRFVERCLAARGYEVADWR